MDDIQTKPNEETTMTCNTYGYPEPDTFFTYIPCPEGSLKCDESKQVIYVSLIEIEICNKIFGFHQTIPFAAGTYLLVANSLPANGIV